MSSLTLTPAVTVDAAETPKSSSNREKYNVALLLALYLLQGVPLGLSAAVPVILQSKRISYAEQAKFSFARWPFSLKLLWAPIVDSFYWKKFGRRKSWLVPTQYFLGLLMLLTSTSVDRWIGDDDEKPNVQFLAITFFITNFAAATQDIAVDGWALTMLARRNVGLASTCNSVGQTSGFFLGYVVFTALNSADFANAWVRSSPLPYGLITFSGFMQFWGLVFVIFTSLIAYFKTEENRREANADGDDGCSVGADTDAEMDPRLNVKQTYRMLFAVCKLQPIRLLIFALLTAGIGLEATDSISSLKFIEIGIPKEKFAMLSVPLMPIKIVLPFLITRYVLGPSPMNIFIKSVPYKLAAGIIIALAIFVGPFVIEKDYIPSSYYVAVFAILTIQEMISYCMFVSTMAFYAKISDATCGGTYMTLLNTATNLGNSWPSTVALALVEWFTVSKCDEKIMPQCADCEERPRCQVIFDGYFGEVIFCTLFGVVWVIWASKVMTRLQNLDQSEWRVKTSEST